jgi:predicted ester cyclase
MNHRWNAQAERTVIVAVLSAAPAACHATEMTMDPARLKEFGTKYTAAWCSQDPGGVAAFFAESGSLKINDGAPAVGRSAIAAAAQGFMTAFPDMVVTMDSVMLEGGRAVYRWTLSGTNTGPGGTGKAVRISGHEEWTLGADGLIAESQGRFDEADYHRQLGA